ncbi:MAG: GFA family protein [Chthoniobacterales bacterium]
MTERITFGGCLCGAIRYQGRGEYHVVHCHCADCRQSSGAPFVTWASFRTEDFHFTKGLPREVEHDGKLRGFCAACGTTLTFRTSPEAKEWDVTVSSFDQPEAHVWIDDRLPWIKLADGLPTHARSRC